MIYGHASNKRSPKFDSFHRSNFNIRQGTGRPPSGERADLEKEKAFLFGPWEERSPRGKYDVSHAEVEAAIEVYLLRGGTIKYLAGIPADRTDKPGKQGEGISSSSNIFC